MKFIDSQLSFEKSSEICYILFAVYCMLHKSDYCSTLFLCNIHIYKIYQSGYPKCFHSLKESCEWFSNFIHWYNYEHKHSGLQYVTPMDKRKGKHIGVFENRNSVLEKAKLNHPERWSSRKTKRYEVRKVEVLNPD